MSLSDAEIIEEEDEGHVVSERVQVTHREGEFTMCSLIDRMNSRINSTCKVTILAIICISF